MSAVLVAPAGHGRGGVAWWGCGVVFEVELEGAVGSVGEHGAGPAGAGRCRSGWRPGPALRCYCCAVSGARSTSGRTLVCRALAGWVVRTRPVGSVQVATPSGARVTVQRRRCLIRWWRRHRLSRLVSSGGSVGPGSDVVDVAEDGGDGAAGEAAAPVAGLDPRWSSVGWAGTARHGQGSTAAVDASAGSGGVRTRATVVDGGWVARAGGTGSARWLLRHGVPRAEVVFGVVSSSRAPVAGWQGATCTALLPVVLACSMVVVSQLAGDVDGLGAVGAGDLDQVALARGAGLDRLGVLAELTFADTGHVGRASSMAGLCRRRAGVTRASPGPRPASPEPACVGDRCRAGRWRGR